jgi:malonyl CoA-acyl carrier protein transacylase
MSHIQNLIKDARKGKTRFYLLFGGQGSGWLKELQGYYQNPHLKPSIDMCLDTIQEELPYLDLGVALPYGFDVRTWLMDPSTIPSRDYLFCSGVSVPMIFITQLACLWNLQHHGCNIEELLGYSHGISGQSQGLFTASFLSLSWSSPAYDKLLRQFTKYVLYLGARSQEVYPFLEATAAERERSAQVNDWRKQTPSPMVAVVTTHGNAIEQHLRRFNSKVTPDRYIYVSLRLSSDRLVLSSHRHSLIEFNSWYRPYFAEHGIKYVYLRTTCPFHSAFMQSIGPRVEADFARIRFGYPGSALRLPVYSFYDGRNLQEDEEISRKLYRDVLINPLEWRRALEPIQGDDAITHVIDFGPGTENQHISQQVLRDIGCNKPILSAQTLLSRGVR